MTASLRAVSYRPEVKPGGAAQFARMVHSSGRYLLDGFRRPIRLKSRTAFTLSTAQTIENVRTFLDDCVSRGFNAIQVWAIVVDAPTPYDLHRANVYGAEPFTSIGDLSTPNPTYFDHIENIVNEAAARNIIVQPYHSYLGYAGGSDQGWYSVIASNSQANCQAYGAYLGARFGSKRNVIWMHLGDYSPPAGATLDKHRAILESIRAAATVPQFCGGEPNSTDFLMNEITDARGAGSHTFGTDPRTSDIQLNTFYGEGNSGSPPDGHTYVAASKAWRLGMPCGVWETPQGGGNYVAGFDFSRPAIRKYHHWAITAGGVMGSNFGVYHVGGADFMAKLDTDETRDATCMLALYDSVPWHLMQPSGTASVGPHDGVPSSSYCGRVLIVSGGGSGDSLITSCMASDGSCLLAYVPPTGTGTTTFSVDFRSMAAGTISLNWWDPLTGSLTSAGTATNADSAKSLTTPSASGRADSSNDWMLIARLP